MEDLDLLNRRLLIISGKGGVGKSVVAATLAWIAATRGKRTLLVELDTVASVSRMFGKAPSQQYKEQELGQNLSCFHVEGRSGLEEYLHLVLKSGRFVRRILRSPVYQYFVDVAPGLKELMAVGKLWDLEQKRQPGTDRPRYDLIVVDTPATGHVVAYLQMPMTAADTAKGFVKREAQKVADLLQDPTRTAFNIVTTLAEMPAKETVDLYAKARSVLRLPIGCLFVNQVVPPFFEGANLRGYEKWRSDLERTAGSGSDPQRKWAQRERALLACAESWRKTRAVQEAYLERLLRDVPCQTVFLPFVAEAEASLPMIRELARSIEHPDSLTKGTESARLGS